MQNYLNPYANAPFPMPGYQGIQPFSFTPQAAPQTPSPQQQGLIKVSGMDGAKAFQMPPNAAVALFHESEDIFYVKTTDGAGFPTIRAFRFVPMKENETVENAQQYVTLDEFNRFKEEINAKFPVQKHAAKSSGTEE